MKKYLIKYNNFLESAAYAETASEKTIMTLGILFILSLFSLVLMFTLTIAPVLVVTLSLIIGVVYRTFVYLDKETDG